MTIHFLNGDTKENVSQEDVEAITEQMCKDGATHIVIKHEDKITLAAKISQILYID